LDTNKIMIFGFKRVCTGSLIAFYSEYLELKYFWNVLDNG